ncbi:C-type lectin domain family 4 member E-like isoform 2-T2 [Clarias gariepinus]
MMQENQTKVAETEDDVYVNTLQLFPVPKTRPVSTSFNYKIIISALALLMLGALTSLCAVVILYHNKVLFTEKLSEKYENVTATLTVLEHKAKETAQLYDMLKVKHQQVHDRLSACSANQKCTLCEKPLGLKCYYVSTEKLSWTQSRDYCVEKGGHLVIITSQAEQDFVSSQIKETHWIGLNDLETEGEWMWVNNQPLNETSVTFWYDEGPHEPDNWKVQDPSGENCAALGDENGNTHKWFDASCHKLKKCICEK